jgi:hypothetical protein
MRTVTDNLVHQKAIPPMVGVPSAGYCPFSRTLWVTGDSEVSIVVSDGHVEPRGAKARSNVTARFEDLACLRGERSTYGHRSASCED